MATEPYAEKGLLEVIAFDPGGTTGWCLVTVYEEAMDDPDAKILDNIHHWTAGEYGGTDNEMARAMVDLTFAWSKSAHIVGEDFVLRKFTMARDLLSPVRVWAAYGYGLFNGVLSEYEEMELDAGDWPGSEEEMWKALEAIGRRRPVLQSASLAKSIMTDDRLRASGLWAPLTGSAHARDAARHAFAYLRRLKSLGSKRARREGGAEGNGLGQ